MRIEGRIVFENLEGGIWGIVDDRGRRFQPVDGLAEAWRKPGRRVRAEVEPADMASFAMWGHIVRLNRIEWI